MRLPRYRFGEFELDPASRELSRNGERVALPPKSFDCLTYLIANRDRAVGRDELIAAVWGRVEVNDTVVAQTLLRARKVLDDSGERQAMIRTVPRFGYRWLVPVQEILPPEASGPLLREVAPNAPDALAPYPPTSPAAGSVAVVEANGTADAPEPSRRTRWSWPLLLLAMLLAGTGTWWWFDAREDVTPAAVFPDEDMVVVMPVTVVPVNGDNAWVRLGAMDYVASRLRRAGLKVLPSDQTLHLSTRFGDPSAFADADWQRLRQVTGARWILAPHAEHARGRWHVRLDTRVADSSVRAVEADAATPLVAVAQATDVWMRRLRLGNHAEERLPSPLTERVQRVDVELLIGQVNAARELIEHAPAEQRNDPGLRVREGQLEYRAGHMARAVEIFGQLLSLQPEVAADIRARALMGQGAIAIRNRDFADAAAHYTSALQILEGDAGQDMPAMLGNAYNGRGVARISQGKMAEAVSDMGLARIAMQRSGDFVEAAMVGSNLGRMEVMRGHYPQALQEFDRAIAVFERFDVHDYLAATLMAKAEALLDSVQPAEAGNAIDRSDALLAELEDPYLVSRIRHVRVRVQLANGHLRDAAAGITRLQGSHAGSHSLEPQELQLRLLAATGDESAAAALTRRLPATDAQSSRSLALAAVQVALRAGDAATARAWQQQLQTAAPPASDPQVEQNIIVALLSQADGNADDALRQARDAAAQIDGGGYPELRVQVGLLQVWLLLGEGNANGAAAVLGDLDSFALRDYRVAWAMLALYRVMDDPGMIDSAKRRVESLRGERDIKVQPLL